ncbi:hypothetical protein V8G54_007347 [Vigna mungo]|uniref:Uncharacterized protein n=1 Tax=Vigna mungo TaxID=3915 RepID=A0AAQ3P1K4_VIGMU
MSPTTAAGYESPTSVYKQTLSIYVCFIQTPSDMLLYTCLSQVLTHALCFSTCISLSLSDVFSLKLPSFHLCASQDISSPFSLLLMLSYNLCPRQLLPPTNSA